MFTIKDLWEQVEIQGPVTLSIWDNRMDNELFRKDYEDIMYATEEDEDKELVEKALNVWPLEYLYVNNVGQLVFEVVKPEE